MAFRTAGSLRVGTAGGVEAGALTGVGEIGVGVLGVEVLGVEVLGVGVLIRKVLGSFKDRKKKVDCKML